MEPRVLVVDRDREYADSLCRRLLSGGYQVTQLHHPRQALEAASLRDYDVAVLDSHLQEIDSERLMSMLEGRINRLQVIFLAEQGDPRPQESADGRGCCRWLAKSRRWTDVEQVIAAAIEHRRRRQPENRVAQESGSSKGT